MTDRPGSPAAGTRTFLVERYWPGVDEPLLRAVLPELERIAATMRAEGQPVDHMSSIFMPTDQVVFTLISAPSERVVRELNDRAGLPMDRITAAIQVAPERLEVGP
jgi:hypothetical protein